MPSRNLPSIKITIAKAQAGERQAFLRIFAEALADQEWNKAFPAREVSEAAPQAQEAAQ